MESTPILIITFPLIAAFLTHLTKYTNIKRGAELVAALGLIIPLALLITTAQTIFTGNILEYNIGGWPVPLGINLVIDGLSFFFCALVIGIGLLILLYSMGIYLYARRYYSLLLIAFSGILGIILTRDIFNMYVFFEILAVASYVLITYKRKPRTVTASFKYLIISESTWVFFLLAIAMLYGLTGTLNMDSIASQIGVIYNSNPQIIHLIIALMMISFGIKCGMFPLHTWIPDAHSQAPTPVSSLLSGLILKVGIYAIIRIFYLLFKPILLQNGAGLLLTYLGAITLIFGACMALVQDELKKLLAYSSINQIGFILVGVGLGSYVGLMGGLFHTINHALIKTALFFCAGIIISQTGFWKVSQLRGVWKRMPGVTLAFSALSLAIIGIPPFNGFFSKLFILRAALMKGHLILMIILVSGVIVTAAYYFRVIGTFFIPWESKQARDFVPNPVGPFEHVSAYIIAAGCLIIGIIPGPILSIIEPAIRSLLS